MVNGNSRAGLHQGLPHEQLPAPQSLSGEVGSAQKTILAGIAGFLTSRGNTRNQAFSVKAKTALGTFVLSFFLIFPLQISAQVPLPSALPSSLPIATIQPTPVPSNPSDPSYPSIHPQHPTTNFQLPHPGYITTPFSSYHPGIDICTGLGMPIHPIANGVVINASYTFWGLGLVVEVDHGNGYKSLYAHMGKIYVQKGQQVDTSSMLGEVGLTGNTTGPHTHLELSYNDQKIDPRPLLPEIRNYPTEQDFANYTSATPSAVAIPSNTEATPSTIIAPEPSPSPIATPDDSKVTPEKITESTISTILTISKPDASPSASPLTAIIQKNDNKKTSSTSAILKTLNFLTSLSNPEKPIEEKLDTKAITQEALKEILSLTTPQPAVTPLPQNEKLSLNFGALSGLKTNY